MAAFFALRGKLWFEYGSILIYLMLPVVLSSEKLHSRQDVLSVVEDNCVSKGRLLFCRSRKEAKEKTMRVVVEVRVKNADFAAKLFDAKWNEELKILGPISNNPFDNDGMRNTEVALPQLGRWARWQLTEREVKLCGEGGVTWAMGIVLANYVGAAPEYPRLRILELGSGTGLVALALAGRGHNVLATDGNQCVLDNLQLNVEHAEHREVVGRIQTARLRWEVMSDRAAIAAHGSFDAVVGADLIYDQPHCHALKGALRQIITGKAEVLLVERDRMQRATACAEELQAEGWLVEKLDVPLGLEEAVINGETNPDLLHRSAASPLLLRIRRR